MPESEGGLDWQRSCDFGDINLVPHHCFFLFLSLLFSYELHSYLRFELADHTTTVFTPSSGLLASLECTLLVGELAGDT